MTPVSRHRSVCVIEVAHLGGGTLHTWTAIKGLLHIEARHGLSHLDTQLALMLTWRAATFSLPEMRGIPLLSKAPCGWRIGNKVAP